MNAVNALRRRADGGGGFLSRLGLTVLAALVSGPGCIAG